MKHLKALLYIILLCIYPATVLAQTLNFNQFGLEEGLPQSGIYTMSQDSQGNIWIGTMAGISKYNGIGFENYNNKNGLAENRVVSSCIDQKGNLWLGHWAGGISLYEAKEKKFKKIIPVGMHNYKTINCIFEDRNGTIWLGTNGQGLMMLKSISNTISDDSTSRKEAIFNQLKASDGLSNDVVNAICQDKEGNIWVGTEEGISIIDEHSEGQRIKRYITLENGLLSNTVTTLLCDNKGRLWMGTNDKGVLRIDDIKNFKTTIYDTKKGLSSNDINTIYEDLNGNIFIGTFGGGVSKYLPELEINKYTGPIFQTISTKQGLSNDRILSLLQDREKNLWIGTYLNLNQYFEEQFEIYGTNEGLVTSLVWSVMQDSKGDIWLGTDGGLVKFAQGKNKNENKFTYYSLTSGSSKLKITATTALLEDTEGYIWYSSFGNGISRMNPNTREKTDYNESNGLPSNEVFCAANDKDGNIWLGMNKGGIAKFDIKTKKITTYSTKNGIGSNHIYTIFCDNKKTLWFGCLGGALTKYDGIKFVTYSEHEGYPNKFTTCITEDAQGNLWLGSYDNGFYKFDGKTFKNYTTKDGASSNTPLLMICDDHNNLWIGSGKGIDKFNLKTEAFKHYGKQDGFLGVEINPNSVCKDSEGNLWFGSIIGAVKYNASKERTNTIEPVTYLKKPRVFFKDFDVPSNHIFNYDQNHLTFDFVGASLTNPKRVKYRFMMEGLDADYSPAKNETSVTYQSLPPGHYTFKVKASNNDGVWNQQPEVFTFTIAAPWWKTWWFYLITAAIIIISALGFFKYREKALMERNIELEQKVTIRTAELREEKEKVEFKNQEISLQKEKIENQNKNITDSIDYAQRIQAAILPPIEVVKELLPDSFILYKPKNIVSGDFYWIAETNNQANEVLFALADCTGHGVPGAFMSIVGYNLLQQITKESNQDNPSTILKHMDTELANVLRKKEDSLGSLRGEVVDAMDIALCKLNFETNKLIYSGAKSPMYIVRNGQITELSPFKKSIGMRSAVVTDNYNDKQYDLQKGDMLYLFSDGFPDQKGGPLNKKFFYEPFRNLLCSISSLSCNEQKQKLNESIITWMDKNDQTDDITILGVRI